MRAFRSNRILRRGFLCAQEVPWHQMHRSRFRHCRTFFSSLGHETLLSVWKKVAARRHWEIHDIQQTWKMVPLIMCEASFGEHVRKLILVSTCLFLSNNNTNATLWVLDTCLIVGLLPLMTIFITASLTSQINNRSSNWASFAFVTTWSRCDNSSTSRFPLLLSLVLGFVLRIFTRARFLGTWSSIFFFSTVVSHCLMGVLFQKCNTSITTSHNSRAGRPSMRKSASKFHIPWNCETLTFQTRVLR